MIPSKYTEQKLANKGSPTINSLLDEKKKKKEHRNPYSYWEFKMPYGSDRSI